MILDFCEKCFQMTNHNSRTGKCLKCAARNKRENSMKVKTTTSINLKKGETALVLGKGKMNIYVPKANDEDTVSDSTLMLAVIAMLLGESDSKLMKLVDTKINKMAKEFEKEEKNGIVHRNKNRKS